MPCLLNTCKFMINNSSKVTKISRNLENMKENRSLLVFLANRKYDFDSSM